MDNIYFLEKAATELNHLLQPGLAVRYNVHVDFHVKATSQGILLDLATAKEIISLLNDRRIC